MSSTALDSGLASERTSFAWTRTALALLGNGVLVMVRHEKAFPLAVSAILGSLFVVVAGLVLVHAARRSQIVRRSAADLSPATVFVVPLGIAVTFLCAATAVAITFWP